MRCPNCDSENHEPTRFCIECGAAFKRSCPKCGFGNLLQAKFCGDCGAALVSDGGQSPTIPRPIGLNAGVAEAPAEISAESEGERKTVTALFADIKGSTELMWQHPYNWERPHTALAGASPIDRCCALLDQTPLHEEVAANFNEADERLRVQHYPTDLALGRLSARLTAHQPQRRSSVKGGSDRRAQRADS